MAIFFLKTTIWRIILLFGVCFVYGEAMANNELAQTFTLDGQLLLAGTSSVLEDSAAIIKIDIMDPSKTCILYEEQQTINTSASDGYFSLQVGSSTGAAKRTSSDPGLTMAQVFQNTSAVTARSVSGSTCASNTYTPAANDIRYFRVTVTPSSTNVADVLSPDTTIDAAPMAMVAQSLQGYAATDFLAKAGLPTCASGSFLTYNGTTLTCAAGGGGGGGSGTVTSLTAGTGLTGGTITTSGTIALSTSGVTAGSYGSASAVPVVTVDTYGRVTGVTTASISSSPTGSASGDLSGTYPGPSVNGLKGTALSISSLTTGQFLKYNGTNWINTLLSVGDLPSGTLSGSGNANYIPYYDASTTLTNSPLYVSGSNIGLGTTSPGAILEVDGDILVNGLTIGLGLGGTSPNTAVGLHAMAANAGGYSNTAIGTNALQDNTTGTNNTATGQNSLHWNQSGNYNTGFGYQALNNNSLGSYNTAVGGNAMSKVTGNYNTGEGYNALANSTTSYNTAFGANTLLSASSGTNNVAIGYNAGSAITTQNNTVILGSNTGSTISDNQVIISDGAGNEYVRIDSGGDLGIGTSSPQAKLDVAGHIGNSDTAVTTVSSTCGVGVSVNGNDTRGTVTLATATYQCAVTLTFANAFKSAPFCIVSSVSAGQYNAAPVGINAVSTTALVVDMLEVKYSGSAATVAIASFNYMCMQ